MNEGFRSTLNEGFHIKFNNKVCVSVQFGPSNYCEHYIVWNEDYTTNIDAPKKENTWESKDAEIAIWREENWITHEFAKQTDWADEYPDEDFNVQVLNKVNPKQVLEALNWAENYGSDKNETE